MEGFERGEGLWEGMGGGGMEGLVFEVGDGVEDCGDGVWGGGEGDGGG